MKPQYGETSTRLVICLISVFLIILTSTHQIQARFNAWDKSLYYPKGSVVAYEGETYRATAASKGLAPPVYRQYWDLIIPASQQSPNRSATPGTPTAPGAFSSQTPQVSPGAGQGISVFSSPNTSNPATENNNAQQQSTPIRNGEKWNAALLYQAGNQVIYKEALWEANNTSIGNPPDQGSAWNPVSVTIWYNNVNYHSHDMVFHQGQYWQANTTSAGLAPEQNDSGWVALGVIKNSYEGQSPYFLAYWTEATSYGAVGLPVYYNGTFWISTAPSQNIAPGSKDKWKAYGPAQDEDGANLLAFQYADPAQRPQEQIPQTDQPVAEPTPGIVVAANVWQATQVYLAGATVVHEGHEWRNQFWSQGEEPGKNTNWQRIYTTAQPHPWLETQIYKNPGYKVSHNGVIYQNKWWTQGNTPGSNSAGSDVWEISSTNTDDANNEDTTNDGEGTTSDDGGDTSSGDSGHASCSGVSFSREMTLEEAKNQGAAPWEVVRVYVGGNLITYNPIAAVSSEDTVWRARYWTQANQPATQANGSVWQLVYTRNIIYPWFDFQIYNTGDIVKYNGLCYRAQHYTHNVPPDTPGNTHWQLRQ